MKTKLHTAVCAGKDFIVPELTTAHANPAMAELIPLSDASKAKAKAHEDAVTKGKAAALKAAA
ncbi:hypothetical protein ACIOHS_46130 [Streptomyces sp. NPDC088253]|uniref:hypothetical protein n=1 Tax=Streptomyces sp. NPDC088253 TaxID=3365846 RepID=UPI0038160F95